VVSGEADRAVVIAVRAAGAVQVTGYDVVDVIAVRKSFVPATGAMFVGAVMTAASVVGSALTFIGAVDGQAVLVYVIAMHMV
jgi:hypothetical protein